MSTTVARGSVYESDVPHRLDRLPWSSWHWRVVLALGITWILDGLEVTLVGAVAAVLVEPTTLGLTPTQIGASASAYLAGAIAGSLFFGKLTDSFGRRRLFLITLAVYIVATVLTAFAWSFASFAVLRAITGMGIGGEGAAVASAIDELMPARVRGRVALALSGSYWLGTAAGAAMTLVLLDQRVLPHSLGWRVCFGLGGVLGLTILLIRRHLPESPRWLLLHGRVGEATDVVRRIEADVVRGVERAGRTATLEPPITTRLVAVGHVGLRRLARVLLVERRRRSVLGLTLVVSQAFAYNAVFFTYALVLREFYGVAPEHVGLYILPFAAGNFLGPLVLGPLFDTVGRRPMIAITYALSGVLLAVTGWAFAEGWLTAFTQTVLWCAVFFVASSAASAGYLTVSELFPVELRAMAIALFYAAGTAIGGLSAPALFGALIESGSRQALSWGYLLGAALMCIAAAVELVFGVAAERKSLEQLAAAKD